MEPLRILHITPFIARDSRFGGVPVAVRQACQGQRQAGHELFVWSTDWGMPPGTQEATSDLDADLSIFVTRWNFLGNLINTPIVPELMVLDRSIISEFDVVHFHNYWNSYTPRIAKICAETRTPLMLQPRGSLVHSEQKEFAKSLFQFLFRRGIVRATSIAIALSTTERMQLRSCGFTDSQIELIPNILSPPAQTLPTKSEARRLLRIPDRSLVVLFLGRLHPAKGVEELLRAYRLLREELPDSSLVFAGPDEGMEQELRRIASELGVSKEVFFLGALDHSTKWWALRAADVFCLPSRFEAFPNAVLEAAWAEVPIVLSTRVSLPYLADTEAVVFSDPVPRSISTALRNVAMDSGLRSKLVTDAHNWAREHFSPEAVIPQLERAYETAIRLVG